MLKFGYAKRTLRPVNGAKYEGRLFPFRSTKPPEAVLEFSVCRFNNEEDEIDVGPGVVSALVPAVGALLQGFVVPFLDLAFPIAEGIPRDPASIYEGIFKIAHHLPFQILLTAC
jgi:hypothetical protein